MAKNELYEALDMLEEMRKGKGICPKCGEPLVFAKYSRYYCFCPHCMDWIYNEHGDRMTRLLEGG